jgi:hypothetical protein
MCDLDQEKEAVRKSILQYIEGSYQGDAGTLKNCFHPKAVMNGYLQDQLLVGDPEPFS